MDPIFRTPESWIGEEQLAAAKNGNGLAIYMFLELPTEREPGVFPCKSTASANLPKEAINYILDNNIIQGKAQDLVDDLRAALNAIRH